MSRSEEPFDTYLLRVLCTLISEKSVSRAAIRLNQSQPAISAALRRAGGGEREPVVVISADAKAAHQSVIDVMQAAQQSGYSHISFATQNPSR